MSRSVRKTPLHGPYVGWDSEKEAKREWHRKMRYKSKALLRCADVDCLLLPHMREISNVWCMPKDGKRWFDPVKYPKGMRK